MFKSNNLKVLIHLLSSIYKKKLKSMIKKNEVSKNISISIYISFFCDDNNIVIIFICVRTYSYT